MKNKIFYGDNLEVLRKYIKDETVDLCYIDPTFNSKRNYNQIYNNLDKEDQAQAQAFIDTWQWDDMAIKGLAEIQSNYNGVFTRQSIDLISGLDKVLGKGSLLAYLVSMTLRIAEIFRVLKPTGSFYLHCDPTCSHYLKLVVDAIFCVHNGDFITEIIWKYSWGVHTDKRWNKKHDVILCYSKGKEITFNAYDVMDKRDQEVLRRLSTGVASATMAADKSKVADKTLKLPADVWDIPTINSMSKERMGYPTQKPEALLERIIKASSNEGDLILDAYCGCGTTVAVAERLKRNWIGIDITYQSISLILKRLEEQAGLEVINQIEINGIPKDMESAISLANKKDDRTRKEFEKWAVLTYSKNRAVINDKKGGDQGIDGTAFIAHQHDGKEIEKKAVIFSVKSNKTLTPAVIRELYGTVERENAATGILLTLYPVDNLVKESKKYGLYHNEFTGNDYPKIEVINIEEILNGKRMNLPNISDVLKKAEQRIEQHDLLIQ